MLEDKKFHEYLEAQDGVPGSMSNFNLMCSVLFTSNIFTLSTLFNLSSFFSSKTNEIGMGGIEAHK
jgi:hypothetical protein